MVATSDFSGLVSSPWALASAAAIAPMLSLQRCMVGLHLQEIKADRAGLGALGAQAVTDRFFRVFRHELLQICFGSLVLDKGGPGAAEGTCKLGPGIRAAHVNNADCRKP